MANQYAGGCTACPDAGAHGSPARQWGANENVPSQRDAQRGRVGQDRLEWVLRSNFELGKADVLMTLSSLFWAAELRFESERAHEVALQLFRKGPADFADCLHVALAMQAGAQPLWTFDKGAAKVSGAQLLGKA